MRRPLVVLLCGILLGLAAYAAGYLFPTVSHRTLLGDHQPELTWLRHEFQLSDAAFARISELHNAYRPRCAAMCRQIEARKDQLRQALARTTVMTPEVEGLLADVARLRLECHKNMLAHFLEVSQAMPTAQGRRYLEWVQSQTLLREEDMARYHAHR